jgi:hypothetical protein
VGPQYEICIASLLAPNFLENVRTLDYDNNNNNNNKYKASYSSLKLSQETLKCHLGLKSAKHLVL